MPQSQPIPDEPRDYASEEMVAELYRELRALAAARIRGLPPGQTLQATALVHEAYLKLAGGHVPQRWQNRAHFFASAAEAMRRVLVDKARRKLALRRGGNARPEPLDEIEAPSPQADDRILAVHEALDAFETENPIAAKIVKLRFFAGLTHDEIASVLEISEKTARRHWSLAKIWLFEKISERKSPPE